MHASFRVSLLYLLLIIPPHGNSPLPVMESWLQKDQDDGIVQRDMTSSLTGGDESFGTAHQTYQNSLIRKKKSDSAGELLPSIGYRKFNSELELNQLKPNPFFDGRYVNQDFREAFAESARRSAMFDDELSKKVPAIIKYRARAPSLRLGTMRHNYNDDASLNRRWLSGMSINPSVDNYASNPSWPVSIKGKDAFPADVLLTHSGGKEIRSMLNSPVGSDFAENQKLVNPELGESSKAESKDPQLFSNNEYYDGESNSLNADTDEDYNEILSNHVYKQKREDTRGNEKAPDSKFMMDALKYGGSSVGGDMSIPEPFMGAADDMSVASGNTFNIEGMCKNPMSDSNLILNMNSETQPQALNNVMKNSQRALQEIQLLQMYNKQPEVAENEDTKRENRLQPNGKYEGETVHFDEKRLKREDEDEQKNMKTGTDEGGGGEYEDEEGKGHKDEEEYYEDADLSEDESGRETQSTNENDQNEKSVKREAAADDNSKTSKADQTTDNTQDYELNLENAPVENSEKMRKNSYREGEKTNKVRKGVKIWDQWGKWSPCSVTCGVGRSTRWRHCIGGGCAQGEKEAQIKRCTNPAC